MHTETNKISSWLSKWSKFKACIPNSLGERKGGETVPMGKISLFTEDEWVLRTAGSHMTAFVYRREGSSPSSGPSHS